LCGRPCCWAAGSAEECNSQGFAVTAAAP
jgi:hypothetical protein